MTEVLFPRPVCVVDTETWHPGGKGQRHRLVEIAAVVLDEAGRPGACYSRLCRPSDLPRGLRALPGNAVPVAALWAAGVPPEREVALDFAEWHFGQGAPDLIAYNAPFDRSVLAGALAEAEGWERALADKDWPLPWGPCLMQTARKLLGKLQTKEAAAAAVLPDPGRALDWMARRVGYRGPLDMHRALPDALIEGALLVALRRREQASAS